MRMSVAKEYHMLINKKQQKEEEMLSLPVGYISKKMIKGNTQYYLQRRDGAKIISSYVKFDELGELLNKIEKWSKSQNMNGPLSRFRTENWSL